MYKEKHILNHHTAGHKLSRYLDVYELNTVNCSADKTTGYKGDTITITGTPAWNQKTSSYSVTGAELTGNQFDFTGSDVTAQANYETAKSITTQSCSANKVSGFSGDNVTVTGTPAWNQKLSGYGITGATLTGNNFKITNSNVTVQGKYETAKNLTLQTDGRGQIAANKTSGFIGDQVTLSNTANAGYEFSSYVLTGATLTGNKFNFVGNNVTAKALFKVVGTVIVDTTGYSADVDLGNALARNNAYIAFMFDQFDTRVNSYQESYAQPKISANFTIYNNRQQIFTQYYPTTAIFPSTGDFTAIPYNHMYVFIDNANYNKVPTEISGRSLALYSNSYACAIDSTPCDDQWHTYKYIIEPYNYMGGGGGECDVKYSAYKDYVATVSGIRSEDEPLALMYQHFTFIAQQSNSQPVTSVKNLKVSYFNSLADAEAWRMDS